MIRTTAIFVLAAFGCPALADGPNGTAEQEAIREMAALFCDMIESADARTNEVANVSAELISSVFAIPGMSIGVKEELLELATDYLEDIERIKRENEAEMFSAAMLCSAMK